MARERTRAKDGAGWIWRSAFHRSLDGGLTVHLSDVRIHPQTGDVLGTEVTLDILNRQQVVGTIRSFEGSCEAEVIRLEGSLKGEELSATGKMADGTLRLDGRLTNSRFLGRLLLELSRQTNVVQVDLPVVKNHVLCRSRS